MLMPIVSRSTNKHVNALLGARQTTAEGLEAEKQFRVDEQHCALTITHVLEGD